MAFISLIHNSNANRKNSEYQTILPITTKHLNGGASPYLLGLTIRNLNNTWKKAPDLLL